MLVMSSAMTVTLDDRSRSAPPPLVSRSTPALPLPLASARPVKMMLAGSV